MCRISSRWRKINRKYRAWKEEEKGKRLTGSKDSLPSTQSKRLNLVEQHDSEGKAPFL